MAEIGFVGLGRMGLPMALHLSEAGHDVLGVDVSGRARQAAEAAGIPTAGDLGAIAGRGVVMSSLPATDHVEAVYLGGVFEVLAPGSVCTDLSTISVERSRAVASAAARRGIAFLDAPVSGTSIHAREGSLAVMVGGPFEALERVRPLLASFSSSVRHLGPNGSGLEMKLITNRLLTAHLVAIGEAIVAMEAAGLDVTTGIELLRAGAVPRLLEYKAGPMAARDFTPLFTVALMGKDLRLAAERRRGGAVTEEAARVLWGAEAAGLAAEDVTAVMEVIEGEMAR